MTDNDRTAALSAAMAVLRERTESLGEPSLSDGVLSFGASAIPLPDFEIVTSEQREFGCEATIFVARGDGFVRAATTIFRDESRAVGTELDPDGPVIGPVGQGHPYHGPAEILGVDYDTYYEPIFDASGAVIGAYLVAYPQAS